MKPALTLVKETKKNGITHVYKVVDQAGNVIATRTSNRDYVAVFAPGKSVLNGFGRLDLMEAFKRQNTSTKPEHFAILTK